VWVCIYPHHCPHHCGFLLVIRTKATICPAPALPAVSDDTGEARLTGDGEMLSLLQCQDVSFAHLVNVA